VVFRSSDGARLRKLSAGEHAVLRATDLFWIETEQGGCSLIVERA